jgi:3-deoxy-D-manno-octulosonic-acid transferase
MSPASSRRLYTLGWYLALPLVAAYLLARSLRQRQYRRFWAERFLGRGPAPVAAPGQGVGPTIWIHAVSVGETRAAQPLIERLAREHPGARFVLTHMTPTGREAAEPILSAGGGRIVQRYLPYDMPGPVRRFLSEVRPSVGVLMETEIWPNLQAQARRAGVPMLLASARLSERSLRRALRWPSLMRSAAGSLAAIAAQTPGDRDRWSRLYDGPIQVTGNLKFDAQPSAAQLQAGRAWRARFEGRPVWLFASTRDGEESLIVDALLQAAPASGAAAGALASSAAPAPVLLFVPRHPQRFEQVQRLLGRLQRPLLRRAQFDSLSARSEVLLGDSMGEMPMYYAMADLALIGGSLLPLGGQNLIEACACGCPVVFGPHMFNFPQAADDALRAGAALQVADARAAIEAMGALQADPARRAAMAAAALAFARAHCGAAERTAALIAQVAALAPVSDRAAR